MKELDQQFRLRVFWGNTIFSLGVIWGLANLVYCPIAALTSIVGSSWLEVAVIIAGGALSFCGSLGAFYRRRLASQTLLLGGLVLLMVTTAGQEFSHQFSAHGIINLFLLFLAGLVALSLGLFGLITERKGWPPLRGVS